ncbi:indolepyruvate ferredoxin oxidoreductase family protein [Rhodovibrionaceae bacterium A322]
MPDGSVSLDDKYTLDSGRIFLTGTQALVRLPLMQRQRDLAQGLNTAGFISGYRGSPLGAFDQQLWRAKKHLKEQHIHFQPGVNEDLAATAVWGSQQGDIFGDFNYDGVFGIWYGKGPGVDRCGDVFRHANFAGTAKNGGVLVMAGDDHAAKSSTAAHQCEYAFMDAMIPTLAPAGVQDFLDLGLYGWAMSRFSGCWVGFKAVGETVDSSASCYVDPLRIDIKLPEEFQMPEGGLNIRWGGALDVLRQEEYHHRYKMYAALAFARANRLNKAVIDGPKRRIGIISAGKAYLDLRQALDDLGITEELAKDLGISLYKVTMSWPLEPEGIREFCEGLDEVLVVEEKRAVIENQLKEQLYNWDLAKRPRITGKFDRDYPDQFADPSLPSYGELSPAKVARALGRLLERAEISTPAIRQRLEFLDQKENDLSTSNTPLTRIPHFCSGCPHNSSTKVPEGSRALAGIGCHYMVQWMDRSTQTFTQMGGEGITWVGQAPFTKTDHVFVNLGDGTYYHSGLLAIRQAAAADVNVTYKILFNDAVAMTGGQPVDGPLDPMTITRQVAAEGVKRIVVVTDETDKYPIGANWAPGVDIRHRDDLDEVQQDLRRHPGVTAIIYDQTCAAEKRRRRKRGLFPDPDRRIFINDAVCEGCGDCSLASNCVSVVPVETELGTKRAIDQSSCNKDFSCVNGFCPSFVSVSGAKVRKQGGGKKTPDAPSWPDLPEPKIPTIDDPYGIVITGVGGTGVVTIGALLGMAAHIEGLGVSILDMAGLAQKGGAVISHLRLAKAPEDLHAVRISAGGAKLMLGCDLVVASSFDALSKVRRGETAVVINSHESVTGDFTRTSATYKFPGLGLQQVIKDANGDANTDFVAATEIATHLLGDSIASNLFMLGYAWQKGLVPMSGEALNKAIELNGVAVDFNKQAFLWGRRAAHDLAAVEKLATPTQVIPSHKISQSLDEIIDRRIELLTAYQNFSYADRYAQLVARVRKAEADKAKGFSGLSDAVARFAYKVMAYKDEYEVARLYSAPEFKAKLSEQFSEFGKLKLHLAPPLLASRDLATGHLKKSTYGPWIFTAMKLLARFKGLRGSVFDPFGHTAERKAERKLIEDYFALVEQLISNLTPDNHALAVQLAELPDSIRGYGHVREENLKKAMSQQEELLTRFHQPELEKTAAQ